MPTSIQSDSVNAASSPSAQLAALLHGAGISPLDSTGWIRVSGKDRVRWLNGMVTNSVKELQPGKGCYTFMLSAQGRIQGDAYIFAEAEAFLLEAAADRVPGLIVLLGRFIIMDKVELADESGARAGLSLSGPRAVALLEQIGLSAALLGELEIQTVSWNSADITLIHAHSPLVPRFEIWAQAATIEALSKALLDAGAASCGAEAQEWLRLLEGTPRYGTDIRDRELPQETGQIRALHFTKGCYLGQEIVERIRSRGNVHRAFTAFHLEGSLPAAGTPLEADGKPAGELTSVAAIPLAGEPGETVQFALGYARREALERDLPLLYPGGTATPVPVPFTTAEPLRPASASESSERV
ncbi:MAG: folate-binding protein YgfZ [Acidobacteriales bacterium 59-55]|nr:folate-binding protein [Terriglobales bacterium]ODU55848.1 MAG: folate-binding protein [Granulicella sp. SCN 62-9]OJV43399.1 MAG: folate-binding protein YgfZ [Acidobacteriales bacterium 59-55]